MAAITKNNKWLGYTVYVVLVVLALLYYLFPAERVEDLVDSSVARVNPELGFEAAGIRPWLPPGLRITDGRIYLRSLAGLPVFAADSLYIRPRILKLAKGNYDLKLSGTAYDGAINGSLNLADAAGESLEGELSVEDLDLGQYGLLAERMAHRLTGLLSGSLEYTRDSANPGGSGKAELRLSDGQLQLQAPIFNISSVDLQKIELALDLRNRNVTIVKGELAGPELNATLTGSIQVQPNLRNSQLNLQGTLEPLAEFYRKYPEIRELLKTMKKRVKRGQYFFAVTGTIGQPRFRLL